MSKLISPSEMKNMFLQKRKKPSEFGKRWHSQEDNQLLIELEEGLSLEKIAELHNRSIGGILCRCKENAYKMYLRNISIEEIIEKTKLTAEEIREIIEIKQKPKQKESKELDEIKKDIQEIKNSMKELIEMIKAIYEFED